MNQWAYLILGNSAAGMAAAQAIRSRDQKGEIAILSEEDHVCYYRPNLDAVVAGTKAQEEIYIYDQAFYEKNGFKLTRGLRAVAVNPGERKVIAEDGRQFGYEKLLLATGAWPRQLPWPQAGLAGVTTLRNIKDAQRIISLLPETKRAVVVGGGLLGIDMVQALNERGVEVTQLVREKFVGSVAMDPVGCKIIERRIREAGVQVALEEEVAEMIGNEGRIAGVVTSRGRRIECQLLVACIGVTPRVDFLAKSGILLEGGVRVDEYLETSCSGIYAAGDVARVPDWLTGRRSMQTSWFNATSQGMVAGSNMADPRSVRYRDIAYNFIDIYGLNQTTFGLTDPAQVDEIVTGDYPRGDNYKELFLRDNKIVGGMYLTEEMEDLFPLVQAVKKQVNVARFKGELLKEGFSIKEALER